MSHCKTVEHRVIKDSTSGGGMIRAELESLQKVALALHPEASEAIHCRTTGQDIRASGSMSLPTYRIHALAEESKG